MSLLLPLLVDSIRIFIHDTGFGDLLSRLVAFLFYNFTVSVDFLEGVAPLGLVPLHHGLAFRVHVLVVGNQVECDVL